MIEERGHRSRGRLVYYLRALLEIMSWRARGGKCGGGGDGEEVGQDDREEGRCSRGDLPRKLCAQSPETDTSKYRLDGATMLVKMQQRRV